MPAAAPASVTVHLLLFASYAEALGYDVLDVTLPAPVTVGEVVAYLRTQPGGQKLPPKPLCARNLAHARLSDSVNEGDEVAILPPLAGG